MQHKQPWFIGAALLALGRHVSSIQRVFTSGDLRAWEPAFATAPGMATMALTRLQNHNMIEPERADLPSTAVRVEQRWRLTPKGLATCRAVAQAQPGVVPDATALTTRLWNLLRIRRTLTSEEAASLLVDAGGGDDLARTQRSVSGYLRAWAILVPQAVQLSAKRVGGYKRYVLVQDTGIHPPPTNSNAIAPVAAPVAHPIPANRKAVAK